MALEDLLQTLLGVPGQIGQNILTNLGNIGGNLMGGLGGGGSPAALPAAGSDSFGQDIGIPGFTGAPSGYDTTGAQDGAGPSLGQLQKAIYLQMVMRSPLMQGQRMTPGAGIANIILPLLAARSMAPVYQQQLAGKQAADVLKQKQAEANLTAAQGKEAHYANLRKVEEEKARFRESLTPEQLQQVQEQDIGLREKPGAKAMREFTQKMAEANLGERQKGTEIAEKRLDLSTAAGRREQERLRMEQERRSGMKLEPYQQQAANQLSDNYRQESKDYFTIRDYYGRLQAGAREPSAAGDLSMIFSYMKMLDPTSVVREGEQATARNAGAIPPQVMNLYNRLIETGETIPPAQRKDFLTTAGRLYGQTAAVQQKRNERYATRASYFNLPPELVIEPVLGPEDFSGEARAPAAAPAHAPAGSAPTPMRGSGPAYRVTLKNGKRITVEDLGQIQEMRDSGMLKGDEQIEIEGAP